VSGETEAKVKWFVLHVVAYHVLLAVAWSILTVVDETGILSSSPGSQDVGSALAELFGYYWFLALCLGGPTTVGLVVLLVVGRRLNATAFRLLSVVVMVLGGAFVIFIPSFWVYVTQFVMQLAFGCLVRPVPGGARREVGALGAGT
jgi:hypothetical protein